MKSYAVVSRNNSYIIYSRDGYALKNANFYFRLARHGRCAIIAALLTLLAVAPLRAEEKITLNFVNADIESVVKTVGIITGKNFILDPRVKGTINIVSSNPVDRDLVYSILLSALRLQGFAAIEGPGDTVKVMPEAEAKFNYSQTTRQRAGLNGDKIVTHVYPLQYESANQLVPILRPLIGPNNTISAYPNTNTLVITDYASNIKRLVRIIESIDRPSQGDVEVIKLHNTSAVDIAQILPRLLQEGSGLPGQAIPGVAVPVDASQRFSIVADPRTNSLLVRADNPSRISKIRALAAKLDTAGETGGNIHVVYLRNAEAPKLAETLRALMSGESKTTTGVSAMPQIPGAPAAALTTSSVPASSNSSIQADAATNSLIITAPEHTYRTLRAVIDQLDTRRAQIFVEALIVEVTSDKAAEFGFQWQDLTGINKTNTQVIGGTNFNGRGSGRNIIDITTNVGNAGRGLNIGIIRGQVTLPGLGTVLNLGVLARALESDANANILSTPNLLTMDNEEAKIVIGKNVPFITGSYAQSTTSGVGGPVNPFQTIERRDVGLTLKVKPQIAEGGTVKLQIFQEVSSIDDQSNVAGIITNKRSIESTVLVDDGQIVVLGGLIQDDTRNNVEKVPGFGDIPLIGNLFKTETRGRVKTNLMVFLRPYVLRSDIAARALTLDRYDYIRNEQSGAQTKPHFLLPEYPAPLLPESSTVAPSAPAAAAPAPAPAP